jgi:hypothetical protein
LVFPTELGRNKMHDAHKLIALSEIFIKITNALVKAELLAI